MSFATLTKLATSIAAHFSNSFFGLKSAKWFDL